MVTAALLLEVTNLEREPVNWYAIYTCSRHEKVVAKGLALREIEAFLPLYRTWHRWKDRRKQVELALFPSYVFVRIADHQQLRVLQVPGVLSLVSFHGKPAPLPEREIDTLRSGLENHLNAEPHSYLRVGQRVRVVRGPMAGAEGIILRKKEKIRVVISIDVLMRSIAVEIDGADLEQLPPTLA